MTVQLGATCRFRPLVLICFDAFHGAFRNAENGPWMAPWGFPRLPGRSSLWGCCQSSQIQHEAAAGGLGQATQVEDLPVLAKFEAYEWRVLEF